MRNDGFHFSFSEKMPKTRDFLESYVACKSKSQKSFSRGQKEKSRPETGKKLLSMDIFKLGELSLPGKLHRARGAVAVLGDNDLGGVV